MKNYEVRFFAEATDDLHSIYSYIAEKSSFEIADGYLARIERLCFSLESLPQRGTAVPGRMDGLRTMGFERRATILFRIREGSVEIFRILYGGRDMERQLRNTQKS